MNRTGILRGNAKWRVPSVWCIQRPRLSSGAIRKSHLPAWEYHKIDALAEYRLVFCIDTETRSLPAWEHR